MTQQPAWRLIGRSIRGASHHRAGLPNQDAICCLPETQSGPPLILAVSDGHGSAKSFRSHRGSRYAVKATVELMRELAEGRAATPSLSAIKRVAEERLPRELLRRWREAVDADLTSEPFSDEELDRLKAQRGDGGKREVLQNPHLAYGATVLGVLVERDYLLFLQLGDGDILIVSEAGEVSRPIDRDSRLIANETTSLCMERAWREIRTRFQTRYGTAPALILAATDGYANSFVNDAAFLQVGSDILEILRRDGVGTVQDSIGGWLQEASEAGSGDDITLGILYRIDAITLDSANREVADLAGAEVGGSRDDAETGAAASTVSGQGAGDEAPVPRAQTERGTHQGTENDPDLRSRMLAQLKHKGPTEPSKQVRLRDLVEPDDDGGDG